MVPIGLFILVEQFLSRNLLRRNILQNRRHDGGPGGTPARQGARNPQGKGACAPRPGQALYEKETITGEEFIKILEEEQAMCILPSRDEEQK
ncbi:MAG: hypothetical protein GX650_00095 [Clostridiales bacterium]|nr:hypothetical protein [Clostridiales bacterium]